MLSPHDTVLTFRHTAVRRPLGAACLLALVLQHACAVQDEIPQSEQAEANKDLSAAIAINGLLFLAVACIGLRASEAGNEGVSSFNLDKFRSEFGLGPAKPSSYGVCADVFQVIGDLFLAFCGDRKRENQLKDEMRKGLDEALAQGTINRKQYQESVKMLNALVRRKLYDPDEPHQ